MNELEVIIPKICPECKRGSFKLPNHKKKIQTLISMKITSSKKKKRTTSSIGFICRYCGYKEFQLTFSQGKLMRI